MVFISEGMQLRFPEGALQIRVDEEGSLSSPPVHFEVRLDVWPYWLDVGLEHALAALHARGELEGRASEQTGQWTAELLENECRAGMVAIASAAFALDALYASIVEAVSGFDEFQAQWREKQTGAPHQDTRAYSKRFSARSRWATPARDRHPRWCRRFTGSGTGPSIHPGTTERHCITMSSMWASSGGSWPSAA